MSTDADGRLALAVTSHVVPCWRQGEQCVELMSMTELDQSALTHTEVREAMYDSAADGLVLCF